MLGRLPRLGNLARTSILVMFWQGIRIVCLAAWIIIGARVLGATNYGLFSGTVGTASALAGLVGLGGGMLMYQYSASDRAQFPRYWKQCLFLCVLSALPLSLLFSLLTAGLLPWHALGLIALSEIIAFPFVTNAAFAFSANDRLGWSAALPALNAILRLAAICVFSLLPLDHDLTVYLMLHLASSAAARCWHCCWYADCCGQALRTCTSGVVTCCMERGMPLRGALLSASPPWTNPLFFAPVAVRQQAYTPPATASPPW